MSYYDTPSDQPDPNQPNPSQPGGDPYAQPAQPGGTLTRPPAMSQAVLLMKVGAALSVLGALLSLLFLGDVRSEIERAANESGQGLSESELDAAVSIGVAVGIGTIVVFGLIGAGLWLWMAWANGRGKSWARIVATVFYGISVLFTLLGFTQPRPIISTIMSLISLALSTYIIFLLYKKESSEFYRASSAPRY